MEIEAKIKHSIEYRGNPSQVSILAKEKAKDISEMLERKKMLYKFDRNIHEQNLSVKNWTEKEIFRVTGIRALGDV